MRAPYLELPGCRPSAHLLLTARGTESPGETGRNRHALHSHNKPAAEQCLCAPQEPSQPLGGLWAASPGAHSGQTLCPPSPAGPTVSPFLSLLLAIYKANRGWGGKQVSEATCTPHIWPLMSEERGWQLLQLPARRYLASCTAGGCCLLLSAKCCIPPAKRLRMGSQPGARVLIGF